MIQSKKTCRQMAGWKGRETLFHRILPAYAGGLISTTEVDWHLKVKDIECDVALIEKILHHYQHAKNQLKLYTHS